MHLHTAASETAREFARRNLKAFHLDDVDAIIVNAAGCGSTLKEYGDMLAGDPAAGPWQSGLSAKTKDISEFLFPNRS